MRARIALFGGTFDPVHNAHIEVARAAADRFGLEKVLFVPAANPPHKTHLAQAPYADRTLMTELACAEDARFEVSRIEEGSERSYSIGTIEKLRETGMGRLAFLIGADAFAEIESWRRWEDVVRAVDFIVVTRPGAAYRVPEEAVVHELAGLDLPISSSEIRARIARGERDLPVPPAVRAYIEKKGLYRTGSG